MHPAIYSDGTIPVASAYRANPWALCTQNGYYRGTKSKLESLFSLEQNLKMITPGLKMKLTFAFDTFNENFVTRGKTPDYYSVAKTRDDEGNLVHNIILYGQEFLGHSSNANYGNNSTYFEATASYNRTFADRHDVDALLRGPMTGETSSRREHRESQEGSPTHTTGGMSESSTSDSTAPRTSQGDRGSDSSLHWRSDGCCRRSISWNLTNIRFQSSR